jgi:hypothetical protein
VCLPPYLFFVLSTFELEHGPTVVLYSQQIKRSFGPVAIKLLIIDLELVRHRTSLLVMIVLWELSPLWLFDRRYYETRAFQAKFLCWYMSQSIVHIQATVQFHEARN